MNPLPCSPPTIPNSPKGEDLILGYYFLYHFNPIIVLKNGLITYDSSHKASSDIKSSASNSLATAVSSVALVGELKTPSLPSSVHIPSIIPSQSFLFQGDMDLPPLSFHASLEEKWGEEGDPEEIETVLKVVLPAYHQYLDVFSKVKSEKLPPHHACDHRIELEGLLPPVGVIYSLSNQDSETLQAYISENVGKGFIRPSSSSTGALVLFVKKKDGVLCLCVDYCKFNAVTRKNRYPVPPMNQLLTVFKGSTIFSKIDLCGAYNFLRIKEVDEHLTAFRTKYGSYEHLASPMLQLLSTIFSGEQHVKNVASVLHRLIDNNLFAKVSKCVIHASSVEYLGYVVTSDGLKMDSSKVQQILIWPGPKNIKALQSFLGFANCYCCFIKNYSRKITALTSLLKKDSPFIFNEEALSQFQILKEAFTTAPILSHFNHSLPPFVETDASYYVLGAVLSRLATLPYSLSCRDNMNPERGVDFISKNPQNFYQVIKQDAVQESIFFSIKVEIFSDLVDRIQKEVLKDRYYKEILKQLARGESVTDYSLEPQAKVLLFKDRVVKPRNEEIQLNILQKHHDSQLTGHPGQEKTLKLIKRDFYWAGMNQLIKYYVSSCKQFSRNKNIHHKKFGLLKPLQIPVGPWNSLSMDFITQLPLSNNFDSILVVVDRFSKMAIFIPAYGTITALNLAQIFIRHVFSKRGLQVSIVSDIGSSFVSSFWTNLCQKLKISRDLSAAFHPETDG
ncbi:hypothetical protein O181_010128 [Austropuccinia psidii MF-1]|uniref:Integrase catalytic domain-containing protein n=1 Tax=Austropuccinia psidii MF-1 TaxID=1389203 RepID=A0A9Q3BSQ6_9BASI|nr:hypothetical protein [Austropuccinia psidii MF-1]